MEEYEYSFRYLA